MVSVLASSAVDCGFEPWSDQTKDYKIDIFLLLLYAHSIQEEDQRLVSLESGWCVRVGQNVYPRTVVLES